MPRTNPPRRRGRTATAAALALVALAACGGSDDAPSAGNAASPSAADPTTPVEVTMLTHDSFVISDDVLASLEEQGVVLELLPGGDAGAVLNQAILTADSPQADLLFGIDSTRLTRGLDAGLFEPYEPTALDAIPDELELDDEHRVTPVDVSDVCVNFDRSAYGDELEPPTTMDDLVDPAHAGQLVVQNPATSSPGLAFLLRTVAEYGEDGWQAWWQAAVDNEVEVTSGWEDAYYGVFSGGASSEGDRPLVVSYSTSPPAEVLFGDDPEADQSPIGTVLDTCYRQVEFVGVLAGTEHPQAARTVVDALVGEQFQSEVPLSMFVEPVRDDVELPQLFVDFAERPDDVVELDPAVVSANREQWIAQWTEIVLGG